MEIRIPMVSKVSKQIIAKPLREQPLAATYSVAPKKIIFKKGHL